MGGLEGGLFETCLFDDVSEMVDVGGLADVTRPAELESGLCNPPGESTVGPAGELAGLESAAPETGGWAFVLLLPGLGAIIIVLLELFPVGCTLGAVGTAPLLKGVFEAVTSNEREADTWPSGFLIVTTNWPGLEATM